MNQPLTLTIADELASFELDQRKATMLSKSTLVPKEFQNNISNCAIGLNMAKRLGADAFMVLQNIDIIHGRPSFRATFLIAMVNASGRFSPLQFRMSGEADTRSCVAWAKAKESGEVIDGPEITMAMAKAEGWSTKAGSKWLTMPELMLRYRAAAFFARLYVSDLCLGMYTPEEVEDMPPEPRKVTGRVVGTENPLGNPYAPKAPKPPEDPQGEAELPAPKPARAAKAAPAREEPAPVSDAPASPARGFRAFYEKMEVTNGESAGKPWKKYTVHYSLPGGAVEKATTFSETIVAPIENADEGVQIAIEITPNPKPNYAPTLTFLELIEEGVQPSPAGEADSNW